MKLVVQVQLIPDADAARKLRAVVERFNEAANWIAGECFARREANVYEIRKFAYHEARRQFGLSSQQAQLAIKAVSDVYKRDKARRVKFRKHAAVPYDVRTMSFKGIDRVSLLTLEGRAIVPFILGKYQADRMPHAKGQCDLVYRGGKWFLIVTVDVPDGTPVPATDFIGVALGVVHLATDSDGNVYSGAAVERVRRRHNLQRQRLQRRNTRGAKKKLKRISGKEARFRRHENHCISKAIVQSAKGTDRGIALEDLRGIRDRVSARGGDARNRLSGWAFYQMREFIAYKARLAGVPVIPVDPRNSSRTCSACGHCDKGNRPDRDTFLCQHCAYSAMADLNAARVLRDRARGALSRPQDWRPDGMEVIAKGQPEIPRL